MPYFRYSGPPAFVVALQQEVQDGWQGEGPAELESAVGFEKTKKPASDSDSKKKDDK